MKLNELIKKTRQLRHEIETSANRIYNENLNADDLLVIVSDMYDKTQELHALETKEY